MDTGAAIAVLLCVLGTLIPLGLLLTALVLRTAVSLFNRFAGSPKTPALVPPPSLAKGMLISLIASVVNASVYSAVAFAAGAPSINGLLLPDISFAAWLTSAPLSLLVLAALLTAFLPTTFSRALLITLCYVALAVVFFFGTTIIVSLIAAVIVVIAFS